MKRVRTSQSFHSLESTHCCNPDFSSPCSATGSVRFFLPSGYEPQYRYPLVVWLHQDGADESEIAGVMPHLSDQNYVGVGVRGTQRGTSAGGKYSWDSSHAGARSAGEAVFNAIERATQRYAINTDRVFIGGFRAGGTMALRVALQDASAFAGGFSLMGGFPESEQLFSNFSVVRHLPLMMAVAEDSDCYRVDQLCADLRQMHTASLAMEVRHYAGGDELCTAVLRDTNLWLMGHVTGRRLPENYPGAEEPAALFSSN